MKEKNLWGAFPAEKVVRSEHLGFLGYKYLPIPFTLGSGGPEHFYDLQGQVQPQLSSTHSDETQRTKESWVTSVPGPRECACSCFLTQEPFRSHNIWLI